MNQQLPGLEAVRQPVATAHGLPNAHYIDPSMFQRERQALFFDQWAAIGFEKDVPGKKDACPVELLGMPLLMLRDENGKVRVFQNTCRHRGMVLIEKPQTIRGAIRCPYHSWCYGLDGRLITTPHVGGPGHNTHKDIHRESLGLVEIRAHVWLGVVFVNVSGNAPDFAVHHAEALARWQGFGQPLYHSGRDSSFALEVACNWKLAVENYCESYHLPWVHPGLNSYSRLEDHYHIEAPLFFSGQGTRVYRPAMDDAGHRFPDFPGLDEKWKDAAEYIALYPNVLLGVHRDHTFAIVLEARSERTTVERVEIFYTAPEALEESFASLRARNTALWKGVFVEDIFVVEGMQRGRYACHFDGGRFSPAMDSPTHCFHHWVAHTLSAAGEGRD